MSLVVEDGTGMTTSESYMSAAAATQYHADRLNDAWADGGLDEQEAALRRATTWIDTVHSLMFIGYRTKGRDQALEWPRTSAYVVFPANGPAPWPGMNPYGQFAGWWSPIRTNEIPYELTKATAEAALRELVAPGLLFPDVVRNKIIRSVSISGAVSVTYAGSGTIADERTTVMIIGALLRPLLDPMTAGGTNYAHSARSS